MRYAFISDIHANYDALNKIIKDARAKGAEKFICLGDVVGYGPQPSETIALLRKINAVVIAGNHDDAVSGRCDASSFIDLASDAVSRHREDISQEDTQWLKSLPYTYALEDGKIIATHGDISAPKKFFYIMDEADATANFAASEAQLLFVGHTHVPTLFLTGNSGAVYQTPPQDFTLEAGKRYIVNPGTVGYPREGDASHYSSYVIYDSDDRAITFHFLPFHVASLLQRGKNKSKKTKHFLSFLIAFLIASLLSALLFVFSFSKTNEQKENLVAIKTCDVLLNGNADFRANLFLNRDSAPAQLKVVSFDKNDSVSSTESLTVKLSSTKIFSFPTNAIRASFTVFPLSENAAPSIKKFLPERVNDLKH